MTEQLYPDADAISLWRRTTKTGKPYYAGVVEVGDQKYKVRAFVNEYKQSPSQPDYFYRKKSVLNGEKKSWRDEWEESRENN